MWFRISKLLKARLEETGYDDDLKDLAKGMLHSSRFSQDIMADKVIETARKQDEPKLSNLLDIITPKARGTIFLSISLSHSHSLRDASTLARTYTQLKEIDVLTHR